MTFFFKLNLYQAFKQQDTYKKYTKKSCQLTDSLMLTCKVIFEKSRLHFIDTNAGHCIRNCFFYLKKTVIAPEFNGILRS